MKYLVFYCLLFYAPNKLSAKFGIDYRSEFGSNYYRAVERANAIMPKLQIAAAKYKEDSKILQAVIFPELIRNQEVYDAIETGSLYALYSGFGKHYADFSIGDFQMKPSFAESIEKAMKTQKGRLMPESKLHKVSGSDSMNARSLRLDRLGSLDMQIDYLIAMVKLIKIKHPQIATMSDKCQLLILSAAYNSGWQKPLMQLESFGAREHFHLGKWIAGEKYCYAEISRFRYNELQK